MAVVYLAPESPRWLAYRGRREEALQVLARINGSNTQDCHVQMQFREIIDALNPEREQGSSMGFGIMLKNKANRKRLFLALSVAPLAMLTGSNVIT